MLRTKSLFQMSIEDLRAGLDDLDSGCGHVHTGITLKLHSGIIDTLGILLFWLLIQHFLVEVLIRLVLLHVNLL